MADMIYPNQLRHILQALAKARGHDPVYHQALKDVASLFHLEFGPPAVDVRYTMGDVRERVQDDLPELP